MRTVLLRFSLGLVFCFGLGASALSAAAQSSSAYSLIDQVNRLRLGNGLPPYQINTTLMAIAQAHSEWQAAIGAVTSEGQDGTSPQDRAIAAGYGSGAMVFIAENVAGGTSLTPQEAVAKWQEDENQLDTLLGENYQEIGAGAASAGGTVYFTLDAAYTVGAPAPPALQETTPTVQGSETRSDGSIIHEVQPGETLIGVAAAYEMSLAELLALNGLSSNSVIYPGDTLIIRPANTATPTATVTMTPTPTPRPTLAATLTPPVLQHSQAEASETPTSTPEPPGISQTLAETWESDRGPVLLGVIVVALLALLAPLLIVTLRRQS